MHTITVKDQTTIDAVRRGIAAALGQPVRRVFIDKLVVQFAYDEEKNVVGVGAVSVEGKR